MALHERPDVREDGRQRGEHDHDVEPAVLHRERTAQEPSEARRRVADAHQIEREGAVDAYGHGADADERKNCRHAGQIGLLWDDSTTHECKARGRTKRWRMCRE